MLIKQEIIEQIDDDLQVVHHHVLTPTPQYVSPAAHIKTLNKYLSSVERERDEAKELVKKAEEKTRKLNEREEERRMADLEAREEKKISEKARKKKNREYQREYRARKKVEKEEERRGALLAQVEQDSAAPVEQEPVQEVRARAVAPRDDPRAREHVQHDPDPVDISLQQFQNNVQISQCHQQSVIIPGSPAQLEENGATRSHKSRQNIKKVVSSPDEMKTLKLENFLLLSKVNKKKKRISSLQEQLNNVLREMEGLKKALKSMEKDASTHDKMANGMKRAMETMAQTKRKQKLDIKNLREELEYKNSVIKKLKVSKQKIEKPEILKFQASRINNFCQSMQKNGKSSGNGTRSRPY